MTTNLEEQQRIFNENDWDGWSFKSSTPTDGVLALAQGVSYINDTESAAALDRRNEGEGRKAKLSDTGFSLAYEGLYVGVLFRSLDGDDAKWGRLKFETAVPLDEAISGDQPPITGKYPRVVFPAEGVFRYGVLFTADPTETAALRLGTEREEHTVLVHPGDTRTSIEIPAEAPCDKELRAAIAKFDPQSYKGIPAGRYVLKMEVERMPIVMIRVDGGKPFTSALAREGGLKPELPIMDLFKLQSIFDPSGNATRERKSPLQRNGGGAKYWEIATAISMEGSEVCSACFDKVSLKTGGNTQEEAELRYVALRRKESVAEVYGNPNFGLIEVQVARIAKIHSLEIDYTPESLPPRTTGAIFRSYLGDLTRGGDSYGGSLKSFGGGNDLFGTRDFSTPSVNVGRTELAKPRVAPASPTMEAEWDGHLRTFRFCLTNHIS